MEIPGPCAAVGIGNDQQKTTPVPVVKLGNQKMLELDLTKVNLPPGDYRLTGFWDWTAMKATGAVHVLPLSDFKHAHLDPASLDLCVAKSASAPKIRDFQADAALCQGDVTPTFRD